jgi:hypothetical protein
MENTGKNIEKMENSAAPDVGSCSEAPEGTTGQDPVESRTGGTPLIEEEHPSDSYTAKNLEGLTEKFGSLGLVLPKKNHWCRQKAGEESQAGGGSEWGL